jgi:hypothetical protein
MMTTTTMMDDLSAVSLGYITFPTGSSVTVTLCSEGVTGPLAVSGLHVSQNQLHVHETQDPQSGLHKPREPDVHGSCYITTVLAQDPSRMIDRVMSFFFSFILFILSCVYGFMIKNNGFWIG